VKRFTIGSSDIYGLLDPATIPRQRRLKGQVPRLCLYSTYTEAIMDSLGKAFKTGLAKAYAAGQQQVQQRVSKLQDQSSGSKPPQGYGYGGGQYGAGYYNAAPVSRRATKILTFRP